jgi:hypothetical protein
MPYACTKEEEEEAEQALMAGRLANAFEAANAVVSQTRWAIQCARSRMSFGVSNADEVVVTDDELLQEEWLVWHCLRDDDDEAQVRRILRRRGFAC